MRTLPVTFDDGEVRAALTVRASDQESEMQRAILLAAAQNEPAENAARFALRRYAYPDMLACTTGEIKVGDVAHQADTLPFDVFRALPGKLSNAWNEAVYQLNGHWLPVVPEEAKKGQPPSTEGSADSSKPAGGRRARRR